MKEFKLIVRVDRVSKDGNVIIKKACEGVVESIRKYYGVRVRAQPSMSRIYKRDVKSLPSVIRYVENTNFYGEGIVDTNHTLVMVSLSITSRELNYWKLKSMETYLDTVSGRYKEGVFCNVGE